MQCPQCHVENPAGMKFCGQCATPLSSLCPSCGASNPPEHKFCGQCATPIAKAAQPSSRSPASYTPKHLAEKILTSKAALEGERKQVTVFFCDIVNSTPLAEVLGAEGMHELLNEFFDVALDGIHRYEGTINQFLGDGFMALFGAPIAHEDHARRAALAALDIRIALEKRRAKAADSGWRGFHVRMGLNSGFLVVGKIGNDLRMDYTAVGDTTNIAARIQSAAGADEILLSDSTRRLVEGYIDLEELPPAVVKGKREPIDLYKVVGVGKRRSPIEVVEGGRLTPFVGRAEDLAVLSDTLWRIRPGHGEIVDIEGDPGVGKSRLIHEFLGTLPTDGVSHVVGRCISYGGSIPYLPILEVLRQYYGIAQADEPQVVASRLRAVLEETSRSPGADLPYLLQFMGVKEGAEAVALLDSATIKGRTFEILRATFIQRDRQRPLVLTVEDLHWIDASSLEFLAELASTLALAPILLVVSFRPGFLVPWSGVAHATHMLLRPLSPPDSAAVVNGAVHGGRFSEAFTALILNKGEGNPFFLEELARALTEQRERDGTGVVPDTVQGVLSSRIDRLPEEDKQLLGSASVLGREFPLSLLAAVWQGDGALPSRLRQLARGEFLYERVGADEPVYVFKHALTQEVAYESILTGRRQTLHRAAAEALEARYIGRLEERCELIAHHYSRSGARAKAIDFLELANGKAIASHAMAEAKDFFSKALDLLEGLSDTEENLRRRVVLVLNQFPVFHFLHAHQEYYDLMTRHEAIVDALGDPGLRGSFLGQLGQRLGVFGEVERACEVLPEAAALCDAAGNSPDAAHAYVMLEWMNMLKGDYVAAEQMRARAMERLREVPVPVVYMFGDVGISLAYAFSGRWQDAVRAAHDGYERGEELSDDGIMSFCSAFTSFAYICQGDWNRAIEHAQIALSKAPTVYFRGWGHLYLAAARCGSGQVDSGLDTLASIVHFVRAVRHELGYLLVAPLLGNAYVLAGHHEKAEMLLEELVELADRCGAKFAGASARRLLAEVAMRVNPEQQEEPLAAALFERSIEVLREIGAENELGLSLAGYGRLRRGLGDLVKARDLLTLAHEIFERLGTMHEPAKVAQQLSALPS